MTRITVHLIYLTKGVFDLFNCNYAETIYQQLSIYDVLFMVQVTLFI